MADLSTLKRLTLVLEQAAGATPLGETYWPTLAAAVVQAFEQPPEIVQAALPAEPFVAVTQVREGFTLVARTATLAELDGPVTAYLGERGSGEVLVCQIRKVFTVKGINHATPTNKRHVSRTDQARAKG